MPERFLVTGGTGFTGSHLVRRLLAQGHQVAVLDVHPGLFDDELRELGAEIVIGTVTDREIVGQLVSESDVVFHLAAEFRNVNLPRHVYWDVNVEGTRNVLQAAKQGDVRRVVYCSTCGVHGDVNGRAANEDSDIAPEDYYQYTKYEGEEVANEYLEKGLPIVILRPAAIYGPGDAGRWLMLLKQVNKGIFPMFGSGRTTYHPLYIDNLLDAFELAAHHPRAVSQTYLIADDRYYSLDEIVRIAAAALECELRIIHLPYWPLWGLALATELACKPTKLEPPLFRRRVQWFRQNRAFNIERARHELGFNPRVDLSSGLAETIRWYRQNNYLPAHR